jgi:SAM-dependent methyltransferase
MTEEHAGKRPRSWEYYDRRAAEGTRTIGHALAYWTGLGVETTAADIEVEARQVQHLLRAMEPATFVEVGAGPGTFTSELAGWGVALDQSESALRVLRSGPAKTPVVRADALRLPLRDGAVGRAFATHIYGLLGEQERISFLNETRRVADRLVVVDAGRPAGVAPEQWQQRALSGGERFSIYRRHFEAEQLARELGGRALFSGRFYVVVTV